MTVVLPLAPLLAVLGFSARSAFAAPEAHILRIDPRAGLQNGKPILTTVLEVIQFKRLSDVVQPCSGVAPTNTLACWSEQLEKPADSPGSRLEYYLGGADLGPESYREGVRRSAVALPRSASERHAYHVHLRVLERLVRRRPDLCRLPTPIPTWPFRSPMIMVVLYFAFLASLVILWTLAVSATLVSRLGTGRLLSRPP